MALALSLGACGGDADGSGADSDAGTADRTGVVRWAADLSGAASGEAFFDPTASRVASSDTERQWLIYDSLLHPRPDGTWAPGLATSAEILDPQTLEVELRSGVVFSDGSPFDAAAVKSGIERNAAVPAPHPQFRAEIDDLESVEVVSSRVVRLHLNKPTAGAFYPLLGGMETFIVSPTAVESGTDLNAQPVGAGPFVLKEYERERHVVYERNEKYWDADRIRLGGIEYVHVTGGPQRLNALRSGEVDIAPLSLTELPSVQGSDLEVDIRQAENQFLWFPVCKSKPPLDDVRVRQALNLALDRDAINETLLHGEGEPMWMLWPQGTPYYVEDLEGYYAYDPDRALRLLADAGYPDGLELQLMLFPGNPLIEQMAEVVQEQWAEVGVDVELVQTADAVNEFYVETRYPAAVLSSQRGGILKLSGPFRPGSIGNVCQYEDPELSAIIDRLAAAPDGSPEAVEAWTEAQQLVVKESLALWADFIPVVHAWDGENLGGVDFVLHSGAVQPSPIFTEMYVKG